MAPLVFSSICIKQPDLCFFTSMKSNPPEGETADDRKHLNDSCSIPGKKTKQNKNQLSGLLTNTGSYLCVN